MKSAVFNNQEMNSASGLYTFFHSNTLQAVNAPMGTFNKQSLQESLLPRLMI
jgi:hypothetical protein